MFSMASENSISFATVTPSLVTVGAPNFLSMTTFRPLGPSVTFTASASRPTPRASAGTHSVLGPDCRVDSAEDLGPAAPLSLDLATIFGERWLSYSRLEAPGRP